MEPTPPLQDQTFPGMISTDSLWAKSILMRHETDNPAQCQRIHEPSESHLNPTEVGVIT